MIIDRAEIDQSTPSRTRPIVRTSAAIGMETVIGVTSIWVLATLLLLVGTTDTPSAYLLGRLCTAMTVAVLVTVPATWAVARGTRLPLTGTILFSGALYLLAGLSSLAI